MTNHGLYLCIFLSKILYAWARQSGPRRHFVYMYVSFCPKSL